jgi:hypothetical protein
MMADPRRALVWKALLEVVLIGTGVFIGLAAEQWRSDRQHRDQAHAALLRFKTEVETNRAAVQKVVDYHARMRAAIVGYLDPKTRAETDLEMEGIMPVAFDHTAWDLAIATQALTDIDSDLAFELARVYEIQRQYLGLTNGVTQAMYLRPPSGDFTAFLHSVKVYYDDIVLLEPNLLKMYEALLPMIDRALKD